VSWRFSIAGSASWEDHVEAASTEDRKHAYWESAVPHLARHQGSRPPQPCVVVCHVTAPGRGSAPPAGPIGRAKGLLDALHDDRSSGPRYRDLGVTPPLADDTPAHVRGLAVEVRVGSPGTNYVLGEDLTVEGTLLASVPVEAQAPNDIAGTPGEKPKIAAARVAFARAVSAAFALEPELRQHSPAALVVRHLPQRDEDNTWATWVAAVCGVRARDKEHWAAGAPLTGWAPRSIASLSDHSLASPVVYELWGAHETRELSPTCPPDVPNSEKPRATHPHPHQPNACRQA
jgi:hypothetical protein